MISPLLPLYPAAAKSIFLSLVRLVSEVKQRVRNSRRRLVAAQLSAVAAATLDGFVRKQDEEFSLLRGSPAVDAASKYALLQPLTSFHYLIHVSCFIVFFCSILFSCSCCNFMISCVSSYILFSSLLFNSLLFKSLLFIFSFGVLFI